MEKNDLLVEIINPPDKSPYDKKDYRVIKLQNGLRALLISDLANLKEKDDYIIPISSEDAISDINEEDREEDEEDGEEDEDKEEEEEEGSENENATPSIDMEGEKCIRKARKTGYLSAAALCIGVGSFEDPPDVQGLMHFLEHMVFMGSDKYPLENCFDNFIKKCGGNDNAHTDYENTTFYFDVQEIHFKKALDVFAQFFISPLMKAEAMKRERKAVHSEFQEAVNDDDCRKQQVFVLFADETHPMSLFTLGNEKTLQLEIPDENLYSRLHKLRSQFYSAHYMTLAVQARESLDRLQEMVLQIFSKIPNNGIPKPSYDRFGFPFPKERFHKLVKVIPVNDRHTLDINWTLPSLLKHYQCKPLHYIAYLIGHEGFGSIISYFKKRVWAIDTYAGNDESGFEHNTTYALFNVRIHLTDAGFDHLKEVITVVFQYIKLLQEEGPNERIYSEIQKMEKLDFDYAEEKNTSENVLELSEEMRLYPSEHILTGGSLLFQYEPNIIADCLSRLQPNNCNIMLSSKRNKDEVQSMKVEKWFGTEYCIEDCPSDWEKDFEEAKLNPELHLPSPNVFIPEDFGILCTEEHTDHSVPIYPLNIERSEKGELWYKLDNKFRLPRAYCYVYFYVRQLRDSAKVGAMLDLFLNLFTQHIMEALYPASMAQYETTIKAVELGFSLKITGFNDKLYKCLEMILSQMDDFEKCLSAQAFEEMKQQQIKNYHNAILIPDIFRRDTRLVLLQEVHWQASEKMKALQDITRSYFLSHFMKSIISDKYIKMLIQGNVSEEEAKKMYFLVVNSAGERNPGEGIPQVPQECNLSDGRSSSSISGGFCPVMRTRRLKPGEWFLRVKGLNPASTNSSVVNYYQGESSFLRNELINEFIIMAMDEPVFDHLRTKEQLGYHVYCTNRNTFGVLGISVTVNSQANKYSVTHINERIEAFLKVFSETLANISPKEMSILKDTLRNYKLTEDLTLKEEVDRNWEEVTSGEYLFSRFMDQLALIPSITAEEVSEYLRKLVLPSSNEPYRKLSVQVVGSPCPEKGTVPCHQDTLKNPSEDLLEFMGLTDDDERHGLKQDQFLTHLRSFASELSFFDGPKSGFIGSKASS